MPIGRPLLLAALLVVACGGEDPDAPTDPATPADGNDDSGDGDDDSGDAEDDDSVEDDTDVGDSPLPISFEADVHPLLGANCAGPSCHSKEPFSAKLDFAQPDVAAARKTAKRELTRMLEHAGNIVAPRMPPPPRDPLTDEQLDVLKGWRADGFLP